MSKRVAISLTIIIVMMLGLSACSDATPDLFFNPKATAVPTAPTMVSPTVVPTNTPFPSPSATPNITKVAPTPISPLDPSITAKGKPLVIFNPKPPLHSQDINFVDAMHGWLVQGNFIWATKDGGENWSVRYTSTADPKYLYFSSLLQGSVRFGETNFYTQDGGFSWQKGSLPKQIITFNGRDIVIGKFLDAQNWWGFPKVGIDESIRNLFVTHDGGTTWLTIPFPCGSLEDFRAVNPTIGYFFCRSSNYKTYETYQNLYKSEDGWQTWQLVNEGISKDLFPTDFFFLDEKYGWITASNKYYSELYSTEDGGKTWQLLKGVANTRYKHIFFINPKLGYVTLDIYSGFARLKTEDGGQTWSQIYPDKVIPTRAFTFFDANNGVGVGGLLDSSRLYKTADGGRNWTPLSSPAKECEIYDLSFLTPQQGWVTSYCYAAKDGILRRVYQTTDGGNSWQLVNDGQGLNWTPRNLSFRDAQNGYAKDYNSQSRLYYYWVTHDGGKTFIETGDPQDGSIEQKFINESFGWKLKFSRLFYTVDGGASWTDVLSKMVIVSFSVVDTKQIWVISGHCNLNPPESDCVLLSSKDGGKSWTERVFDNIQPVKVIFIDAKHGWIQNISGKLYATDDGGSSWIELS